MIHTAFLCAATLLARALRRDAAAHGVAVEVVAAAEEPWASLTFTGARHRTTIAADPTPAFTAWLDLLPVSELTLRGHIALEPAIVDDETIGDRRYVTMELVTLETG